MSELRDLVTRNVQRFGARAGLDIRTSRPPEPRRQRLLERERIDLVLDVGAHIGEYGSALRQSGYRGRIVSFEPERSNFARLAEHTAADPAWEIEQFALSDTDGEAELGVADVFSSLLPANDRLTSVFTRAEPETQQTVALRRLDGIERLARDIAAARTLIKLDVQGHELSALRGAELALSQVRMVEVELSVVALYEGQPMMLEVMQYLDSRGFELVDLEPIGRDRNTGQFMQFDGIFVRR
jgi:FkbM family methyltransferase